MGGICTLYSLYMKYIYCTLQYPQAGIIWKECSPPPIAIVPAQSTVINDKVYFYFQGTDSKHNTSICCYDVMQDQWNVLPSLPVMEFGLGHINGMLVAVGGMKKKEMKRSAELYTLTGKKKWKKTLPPMPTARNMAAVLSLESAIVVAGGQIDTETNTDAIEVFKQDTSRWFKCDQFSLPTACSNLSMTVAGEDVYVTGGHDNQSSPLNQTLSTSVRFLLDIAEWHVTYSTIKTQWKVLLDTPAYQSVAATIDGNNLLAMGGWETPEAKTIQNKVYMFCSTSNTWVYVNDLPQSLVWSVSASLPSREILVIGGSDTDKAKTVYKGSLTLQMHQ